MIYLLGQIAACLLLAAIAGWFIGWSWRGFRDTDAIEDSRRTMRATAEVKDRELGESYRRADGLQSQLDACDRRVTALQGEISKARSTIDSAASALLLSDPGGRSTASEPDDQGGGVAVLEPPEHIPAATQPGALDHGEPGDGAGLTASVELAEAQQARDEAEDALSAKTAAVLALQAEIETLRRNMVRKADGIARLEARLVELEPIESRLAERERELERLHRLEREADRELTAERSQSHQVGADLEALQAELASRDRRINELRNRYQDAVAAKESLEGIDGTWKQQLKECGDRLEQQSKQLVEAGQGLQRQIERNRKQDAVHRSVVDGLNRKLAEADTGADTQRELQEARQAAKTNEDHWRQVLAERDSDIAALRERLEELEAVLPSLKDRDRRIEALQQRLQDVERHRDEEIERYRRRLERLQSPRATLPHDDLKQIRGVGPKLEARLHALGITAFEQIARWTDEDIDRISGHLGAFPGRIRSDDWVESARQLLLLKLADEDTRE